MFDRNCKGITLVETMLVVGILGVIVAIAIPTFNGQVNKSIMSDAMRSLYSSIQIAQSVSQSKSTDVVICAGTASGCTTSNNWQNGWVVFVDNNGNGNFNNGELLLRVQPSYDTNVRVRKLPNGNKLTFKSSGEPEQTASFYACEKVNPKNQNAMGMIMSPIGHVRVATDDDSNSVINLHNGSNVKC